MWHAVLAVACVLYIRVVHWSGARVVEQLGVSRAELPGRILLVDTARVVTQVANEAR